MILTKKIEITIINHNIDFYRNLGYNVNHFDKILIPVEHLTNGSHKKVKVKCENCGKEKLIKFQDYKKITKNFSKYYCNSCVKSFKTKITNLKKYGTENVSQNENIKKKKEKTNIQNWKVKNVFESEEIKNKIIITNLNKYGKKSFTQTNEFINKLIKSNNEKYGVDFFPQTWKKQENYKKDFHNYKIKVICLTKKNIKKSNFINNWNGYDYYDNEYIKENFNYNCKNLNYPTIDHKISIIYGYNNKMEPEEISKINNLCFTKHKHNLSKGKKNEKEYIEYLKK